MLPISEISGRVMALVEKMGPLTGLLLSLRFGALSIGTLAKALLNPGGEVP